MSAAADVRQGRVLYAGSSDVRIKVDMFIISNNTGLLLTRTPCPEKSPQYILGITSSDTGRFSKFFHFHNLLKICNKAIIKSQLKRLTTLPCDILMSTY